MSHVSHGNTFMMIFGSTKRVTFTSGKYKGQRDKSKTDYNA